MKGKKRILVCSCYPASFKGSSKQDGPLESTGAPCPVPTSSPPSRLKQGHPQSHHRGGWGTARAGAWAWLLQSSDKASGHGGAARMQTNSSSKVQAVPRADGSTDSSGSLCHKHCPVTLTINTGALQGRPHGSAPSCPALLGAPEDIPENGPCMAPGASLGWTQRWPWGLSPTRFSIPPPACGGGWAQGLAASLLRTPRLGLGSYSSWSAS